MFLKKSYVLSLAVVIYIGTGMEVLPAYSKPIITDEGQVKLMQQINAGQKSKQLTVKEANKLRKDLARIARKKAKMLGKTNRRLSAENIGEIKSDLNDISNNIHKLELEKRVTSR